MRIAIVGLGAVGGFIAARLAQAGYEVCALARGATLQAVRRDGLVLIEPQSDGSERRSVSHIQVDDDPGRLGKADLVVLSVKALRWRRWPPRQQPCWRLMAQCYRP